jgi:hypothetical protein
MGIRFDPISVRIVSFESLNYIIIIIIIIIIIFFF